MEIYVKMSVLFPYFVCFFSGFQTWYSLYQYRSYKYRKWWRH